MYMARRLNLMALLSLALVAATARASVAQARSADAAAAQAVATAYLRALQAADWKAAVGFLDLAPFDRYRRREVESVKRQQSMPPMTPERLMALDPQMPRSVAEFEVRRMNDQRRSMSSLEYQFGLTDPDSVLALSIETLAERWLEVHDHRYQTRRALRGSPCAADASTLALPEPQYRVLGTVVSDSIAYVLFTNDEFAAYLGDDMSSPAPSMLFLRRSHDSWWVIPHNMSGGFMAVSAQCQPRAKPQ